MDELKLFKNLTRNAWQWGITELAEKLGYQSFDYKAAEENHPVFTAWRGLTTIAEALRNLDDRILAILAADPEPDDSVEIPDGV